jgi:hypothetical protein
VPGREGRVEPFADEDSSAGKVADASGGLANRELDRVDDGSRMGVYLEPRTQL